ncbi:MAG TPA: sugar ABC transporter permease [Geminicoccus sp.]|jgi:multiple sugar transport system permease protein|uniref:carbohydrate ABC transporter permease n=1 Tax=Geminicoccus sp. TaxID=2024832 RepID=UPI002E34BF52|nr:sugar ABC transporter permease [Geminicoccus sp.]HEX2528965.1 sugar ABC transporter permease [Geminicoccus sp.]
MALTSTAGLAAAPAERESIQDWLDRQAGRLFIMPAVVLILGFSIFPLIASAYLALSRFKLAPGGYTLTFIGTLNFRKMLTGSQQFHLLGTFGTITLLGWAIIAGTAVLVAWGTLRYLRSGQVGIVGSIGRLITFATALALAVMFALDLGEGGQLGTIATTLFYVVGGVTLQFVIGLGLALICAKPIRGRSFFRVLFFVPLMVTPVGIAYTFRMLADTAVGPFAPLWRWLGYAQTSWSADAWTARFVVLIGDSWQWIPFIFIVLLAAIESQPRDEVEAAQLDGASGWQIFRDITWPSIAPVAATVVLIRAIEAFKIIDLPNVLTNGGPGIATESLTLHAFIEWRALNLGGSAAVAYMLLFLSTIACVSFFNFVVKPMRGARA